MGPGKAIATCLRNYATFTGRASRSEFWWWTGGLVLAMFIALSLDFVFFPSVVEANSAYYPFTDTVFYAILIPDMAVTARRLQDFGIFGAWIPALFLPAQAVSVLALENDGLTTLDNAFLAAQLGILLLCIRPSDPGSNQFGPNPNEVSP